jgi:hypothetical protein
MASGRVCACTKLAARTNGKAFNKCERMLKIPKDFLSQITAALGAASENGNRNDRMSESSKSELSHTL